MKEKIVSASIAAFMEDGIRFNLDDIAKKLGISKKTIYVHFKNKEEILETVILDSFRSVHLQQQEIYEHSEYSYTEKLVKMLTVLPVYINELDYTRAYEIKAVYPNLYDLIISQYNEGWQPTIDVIEQGIAYGEFRNVNINLLKAILLGSMREIIDEDIMKHNQLSYQQIFEQLMDIILKGIGGKIDG